MRPPSGAATGSPALGHRPEHGRYGIERNANGLCQAQSLSHNKECRTRIKWVGRLRGIVHRLAARLLKRNTAILVPRPWLWSQREVGAAPHQTLHGQRTIVLACRRLWMRRAGAF